MLSLLSAFFLKNLVIVFFIYGLSFFFVALAILFSFRSLRTIGLADAFLYLLLFSLIHGTVEWIDMYRQYMLLLYNSDISGTLLHIRFYLLAASFYFLLLFGLKATAKTGLNTKIYVFMNVAFSLFVLSIAVSGLVNTNMKELDSGVRYLLGFPAALLAGIAFYRLSHNEYRETLPKDHTWYFKCSSYIFILYSVFTGLIAPKSGFLFASAFNQDSFLEYTGIPIQVLRTLSAFLISYLMIRAMAISLGQRLIGTFIAFFTITAVLGFTGYVELKLIMKSYNEVAKLEEEEKDFSSLYTSFNSLYGVASNPIVYKNTEFYAPLLKILREDFEAALSDIKSIRHEAEEEEELISRISTIYQKSLKERIRVDMENLSALKTFDKFRTSGIEGLRMERENLNELKSVIDKISMIHIEELNEHKGHVWESIRNFEAILFIVIVFSVFGFFFIFRTFYKIILSPIHILKAGAGQIAEGNLRHRIDIHTADEIQELASDFNIMGERLLERTTRLEATTKELEELAVKDGLTGLFNHRYFYDSLGKEIKRAERYKTDLSLLILDVDDFKHYNDAHGHPEGDILLKKLGEIILETLRNVDITCRHGGEEFSVILPQTGKEVAAVTAERIRRAIQEYKFAFEDSQPLGDVTVSIGASSFPVDSTAIDNLVKKADDALYMAKREGKNRICFNTGGV